MRGRISPKTKERFKHAIKDVIKGLSRKVVVYKQPIKHECPNCYFDRLTNKSTGKCKWSVLEAENKQTEYEVLHPGVIMYKWFSVGRCPICKGNGFTETKRKAIIDCLVIWNPESRFSNDTSFTPAGTEGSTTVQLKTDTKHFELLRDCSKIVVDDVECKIEKPIVSRGLGNESVLVIVAFATDKSKPENARPIKDYS